MGEPIMSESLRDILSRQDWKLKPIKRPDPDPVSPGCESWCLEGNGARQSADSGAIWPLEARPTMLERFQRLRYDYCPCPAGDQMRIHHRDKLAEMAQQEQERALEQGMTRAEIPSAFCRYGLADDPRTNLVIRLCAYQQSERQIGANLVLYGDVGARKTTLAAALLREDIAIGRSGLFLPVGRFLNRLRSTYDGASEEDRTASEYQQMRAATNVDLLVLDDLDELTDWGRRVLFEIMNERGAWSRPTIITTNLTLKDLERTLGKRTYDRLRGSAFDPTTDTDYFVGIRGQSSRGRQS